MTTAARPGQFTGATDNSANGGLFTDTKIDGIPDLISADVLAAQAAATAAKLSETNAATSETNADADATATAEDRVATAADVVSTNADAATASGAISTTNNNKADAQKLAINPVNVQFTLSDGSTTGYSALSYSSSASGSATTATNQASAATASATAANGSAGAALTSETNANTAKVAAEDAQGLAETARDDAISAKDDAESAEGNVQTNATAAANSKADAQKLAINPANQTFTLSDGSTTGLSALSYAAAAAASATAAAGVNGASGAANSAGTASDHEDAAEAYAITATNYAVSVTGDPITGSDYSAKAWAVGDGSTDGDGVDHAAGRGNAKDWATYTGGTADNTEYSSKEYAVGVQATNTSGSSKQWALGGGNFVMSTPVTGSGGTAKYSAAYWADQAASSVATFDERYYGSYASDADAENAHEAAPNPKTVAVGDLYYNTTINAVKYCKVAPSGTGSPVGTWEAIVAVDTSSFATKGFATAMAIAL